MMTFVPHICRQRECMARIGNMMIIRYNGYEKDERKVLTTSGFGLTVHHLLGSGNINIYGCNLTEFLRVELFMRENGC